MLCIGALTLLTVFLSASMVSLHSLTNTKDPLTLRGFCVVASPSAETDFRSSKIVRDDEFKVGGAALTSMAYININP